ncbi:hypothetical protein VP472_10215 [Bacillus sp. MT(2024)]
MKIIYSNVVKFERMNVMEGLNNSYNITKDPKFLAFCSLATEGAGISSNQQCSIGFNEFKALENGKVVDNKTLKAVRIKSPV